MARAGETSQLLNLLNRMFADGCPAGMEREYPHLYRDMERNLDYCHVIVHKGRIVAHAGIYPLKFSVRGREVVAGGIGAVCTDERHRGKGLMSALLLHCTEWMRDHNMPLSILWGDAVRYGRFGWTVAGMHVSIGLYKRSLPALDRYRGRVSRPAFTEALVDRLYELHCRLPFRVARNRDIFGLVLKKVGRRVYTAMLGRKAKAYCLVRCRMEKPGRSRRTVYMIEEWAGSGAGILSILHSLLSSPGASGINICLPAVRLGWWTDLLKGADSWSMSVDPLGQIKIVDPAAALKALGIRRLAPILRCLKGGRQLLAPLLFGPLPPAAHLVPRQARDIGTALPVPLFLFPSDHV